MKRILMVLAISALMAMMMVLTAMPAFAGGSGGGCTNSTETNSNVLPLLNGLQLLNGNACGNGLIGIGL